jgi:hypothetical protein
MKKHQSLPLLLGTLAASATAHALIIPDTVSASSEFNANYLAINTINGSGLPAGYDETSAHANYSTGNHWTTSAGDVTSAFITWGFNTPQSLGGIYIWTHRSNIIAANPGYEPTLFDLTLRDAGSNILLFLDDITMAPDTANAQFFSFGAAFANVSSVRFDVEAVQNPASTYTGLAEVAFTAIPEPTTFAPIAGMIALAFAAGRRSRVRAA